MNNPNPNCVMPQFPSLFAVHREVTDIPNLYLDGILQNPYDEFRLPVSLATWREHQHDYRVVQAECQRGRIYKTKLAFIRSVSDQGSDGGNLAYPINEMVYLSDDCVIRQDGTMLPYPSGTWECDIVCLCEVYEQISCEYGNGNRIVGFAFVPWAWLSLRLSAYRTGCDHKLEHEFYFGFVDNWHGGVDEAIADFHKGQS